MSLASDIPEWMGESVEHMIVSAVVEGMEEAQRVSACVFATVLLLPRQSNRAWINNHTDPTMPQSHHRPSPPPSPPSPPSTSTGIVNSPARGVGAMLIVLPLFIIAFCFILGSLFAALEEWTIREGFEYLIQMVRKRLNLNDQA